MLPVEELELQRKAISSLSSAEIASLYKLNLDMKYAAFDNYSPEEKKKYFQP